jgi:hypothetical protein
VPLAPQKFRCENLERNPAFYPIRQIGRRCTAQATPITVRWSDYVDRNNPLSRMTRLLKSANFFLTRIYPSGIILTSYYPVLECGRFTPTPVGDLLPLFLFQPANSRNPRRLNHLRIFYFLDHLRKCLSLLVSNFCALSCAFLHFIALTKTVTLFSSIVSALCVKKQGGRGSAVRWI